MIRREFDIVPKVSIQQFLSVGYTLNKAELTCIILNKIIECSKQNTRLGSAPSTNPKENNRFKQPNNSHSRFSADRSINWGQDQESNNNILSADEDDEDANPIQLRPNPNINSTFGGNANVNKKHRLPSASAVNKPSLMNQSHGGNQNKKSNIPPNIQKNIKVIRHDVGSNSRAEPEMHNSHNPKYLNQTENSLNKINPTDQ